MVSGNGGHNERLNVGYEILYIICLLPIVQFVGYQR